MPSPAPPSAESRPIVLVVDDTPSARAVLRALLEAEARILEADSGEAALALLAQEPVDVILLDVMMPGLTGFDVTRRVRADRGEEHLPILLVTALTDQAARVAGFEAGADDFISKPFDATEVRSRVRAFLRARALWTEAERLRRDLARLDALKDDLAAVLVHDLRNPLAGLLANLKLLEFEALTPEMRESVDGATHAAERLNGLVDDLLEIRALETPQLTLTTAPADLADVVRAAVAGCAATAAVQGLTVTVDAEALDPVVVDAALVRRATENLLTNALRHAPDGSTVTVRLRGGATEARIEVHDGGSGLPAADRDLLFGKYGAIELRRRGARHDVGLGLLLVHLVAQAHGGTVGLDSGPSGTTLALALPLTPRI